MKKLLKEGKRLGLVAMAGALVAALLLGSVVPAKAAEEKVIRIGIGGIITGFGGTTGSPITFGEMDYLKYINDHGGIDGVRIELIWRDTQGLIPKAILAHKFFQQAGVLVESPMGSGPMETLAPRLQREGIVGYHGAAITPGAFTNPERWLFGTSPNYTSHFVGVIRWIKQKWPMERPLRLGLMGYDWPITWATIEDIRDYYPPELGIEFVGYEILPLLGAIDTSTEWLRLAGKEPDWVCVTAAGTTLTTLIKDQARLEIQKKGVRICDLPSAVDEQFLKMMLPKQVEGVYTQEIIPLPQMEFPLMEEPSSGMKAFLQAAKKYRGWELSDIGCMYLDGWIASAVMVEGIRLAMEKVGFANLTGSAVREGIVSIRNFDLGLGCPPLAVSNDRPWWLTHSRLVQIRNGAHQPVSEWIELEWVAPWTEVKE